MKTLKRLFFGYAIALAFNLCAQEYSCCYPCYSDCWSNDCCATFYAAGEYLYWRPDEDGLAYSITTNVPIATGGTNPATMDKSTFNNLKFEYDQGYRAIAGVHFPDNQWEIKGTWTDFKSKVESSVTAPDPTVGFLSPIWTTPSLGITTFTGNPITSANASWKLHLKVLDVEVARYLSCMNCVSLTPHFGVRVVRIKQDYSTSFLGGTFRTTPIVSDSITMEEHFKAAGVRCGLGAQWNLCPGFGFFGNSALSLLYGEFHLRQTEKEVTTAGTPPVTIADFKDRYNRSICTADLSTGIRWTGSFCNCFDIILQAAWEFNIYFGLNRFKHFTDSVQPGALVTDRGDLTIQGLTARAGISF